MTNFTMCLCQSGKKYSECCEPFIVGESYPLSVESLMRSRYVAYNIGDFDYIKSTCAQDARALFDINEDRQPLNGVRVDVLSVIQNQDDGDVVFKAYYEKQGRIFYMHEHSFFKKIDNKWVYVSGTLLS
jgi:SEC-C motif domain protein